MGDVTTKNTAIKGRDGDEKTTWMAMAERCNKRATSCTKHANNTQTGGPRRGTWYSGQGDTERPVSFRMMVEA
jgi:hypothetical protein